MGPVFDIHTQYTQGHAVETVETVRSKLPHPAAFWKRPELLMGAPYSLRARARAAVVTKLSANSWPRMSSCFGF